MKSFTILAGAGLVVLSSFGLAQAQPSGTPISPFPDAAPHEIRYINGVPCRTVLDHGSNQRIPVQCAGPTGMIGLDPGATGSILAAPPPGAPVAGPPYAAFPMAAPHEIRMINGVPCRTMLIPGTDERVPVACAR